jgi:hypothetical protein
MFFKKGHEFIYKGVWQGMEGGKKRKQEQIFNWVG